MHRVEHVGPKQNEVESAINTMKYEVLKEFEKVCPTELSFTRMKKTMHDIFDAGKRQIEGA